MPPNSDSYARGASWQDDAATAGTPVPTLRPGRVIGAAAAGNLLEWYDWSVYGFLITYIGMNFFPSGSGDATLLLTFATFGAGFLMRPVGAVVVGWIGERRGRKAALMTTLLVMAAGTLPIAFIPSYERIGIWAPLLLLVCRLLQGFSTGGEMGGSVAFLAEWAPVQRRGFFVSFQQASAHGGTLLGCAVAAWLNASLSQAAMAEWGWRVPFLLGGLLLPLALWLRRRIGETPAWLASQQADAGNDARTLRAAVARIAADAADCARADGAHVAGGVPAAGSVRAAFAVPCVTRALAPGLLRAVALIAAPVACQYLFFTYLATFAVRHGGMNEADALAANTAALAVLVVGTPLMGALSDRIGRKPLLLAASVLLLLAAVPVFAAVAAKPAPAALMALQAALALVVAMYHGSSPAAVTELFPTQGRALLVSVAYGLGVALAGGFAPFIATWLIGYTGEPTAPAMYIAAACLMTGWAALRMPDAANRKLA